MKNFVIKKIEFFMFEFNVQNIGSDPAGFGVWYEPGQGVKQKRFAVKIYTSDGFIGEYIPPRSRAPIIMPSAVALSNLLIQKPCLERESIYQLMRRATKHVGESGIGPLDIALWDLSGKICNQPIYKLLGGYRKKLPAYASTIHGDEHPKGLNSPEAYASFAQYCFEKGYKGFKVHGWKDGNPKKESGIIKAVRKKVDQSMDIMYDASSQLKTLTDAIRLGHVCDEHKILWFEDPFADGGLTVRGHRSLKEKIKTPIMIGEHVRNQEIHVEMLISGASDYCRVDPDYDGGITGSYKAAIAAESLGFDVEVHSCGPAMRQLMASLSRSNYYEINLVHPSAPNPWQLPIYLCDYSDSLDCIDKQGMVSVPNSPGLGVKYDWKWIEKNYIDKIIIK